MKTIRRELQIQFIPYDFLNPNDTFFLDRNRLIRRYFKRPLTTRTILRQANKGERFTLPNFKFNCKRQNSKQC